MSQVMSGWHRCNCLPLPTLYLIQKRIILSERLLIGATVQVLLYNGVMPAKASSGGAVISPLLLRQCRGCRTFGSIKRVQKPCAIPFSGGPQHRCGSQRALKHVVAASLESVPLEKLLEVAERAAKAGAAVRHPPHLACLINSSYIAHVNGQHITLQCHDLQVIAEKVDKPRDIEFKGATDLVTDTDKASEEAVLSVSHHYNILLSSAFPG